MSIRNISVVLAICLLYGFCSRTAGSAFAEEEESVKIALATDLHYISRKLTDNGAEFQYVADRSNGKLMLYTEEILDAFVAQMLEEKPAVLILSGDLTYNGEYESHVALAEKLRILQKAGIQVLALSGNHDVNNPYAFSFHEDKYEKVKNTTPKEFAEIYREFGPARAISVDNVSGSYVYSVRDDLRILMLDTNSIAENSLPAKSFSWLEEQLKDAEEHAAKVITVSHQILKIHNPLFVRGYRITNASTIESLYRKYGVLCQLSGHMHIQHIIAGKLPEILTSPLSMTPVRYGWLEWNGESLSYDARETDVEAYAASIGSTDENLLHFSEYAINQLFQNQYDQILRRYQGTELESSADELATIFAETNFAYYTGLPIDRTALMEGLERWRELDPGIHSGYLESIIEDTSPDALHLVINVAP